MAATRSPIATLTTDFGAGSGYNAELKRRLFHGRSGMTIVDITHDDPPHDIRSAAWLVAPSYRAFPGVTLQVIVVDPGVGTSRRMVWVRAGGQHYLAADGHHDSTLELVTFPVPMPRETLSAIEGEVVPFDAFGNLLTKPPAGLLPRLMAAGRLLVGNHVVPQLVRTYGDALPVAMVALVGSQGVIEAAIVQGQACDAFFALVGTRVSLS